jgi:hypothetical protein
MEGQVRILPLLPQHEPPAINMIAGGSLLGSFR